MVGVSGAPDMLRGPSIFDLPEDLPGDAKTAHALLPKLSWLLLAFRSGRHQTH